MKTKRLAIVAAAVIGAIAIPAGAVVKYESDQCKGATEMSYASLLEFHESVEELHSLLRRSEKVPFGAFIYARDLIDARDKMDEKNKEAGDMLNMQIGVCEPVNITEQFAAAIYPDGFSVKNEVEWYREVLDLHNNKKWRF